MAYADDWPSIPRLPGSLFDRPLTADEFTRLAALPNISPTQLRQRLIGVGLEISRHPGEYDPPPSAKLAIAYLVVAPRGMAGRSGGMGSVGVKDWKERPSAGDYYLTWLANTPPISGLDRELRQLQADWPRLSREARTQALIDWATSRVAWPVGAGDIIRVAAVQIGPAKRTQLQ